MMHKKSMKKINKIFSLSLIAGMSFSSIFSFPISVNAEETRSGKIIGNEVRLRSKPTTSKENGVSNIITELDENTIVTVLSMNKVNGSGCNDGWYQVSFQGTNGYICSKYVSINGYDQYDRPWTSPKKAIVGGAKFIASSYIAKGQFTSYLKKFNVNPNAYNDMFNHQYMANLAAPSSEAKSSWRTYSNNGLANLPLSFNIPVFNNMDVSYNRPGGDLAYIERQDYITDQNFENYLNAQGFPESYKSALRALHSKHPNWTFNAMHTNVSFWDAVVIEKNVSSISGGEQYYDMSSGYPIQTEKGWYIANEATVAYYLDPRNFLTENYILQFESLENSDNYTEQVVQGVLNNTFMAGLSILDNQQYASIFVEAGKIANVSAVYLASLAKQESGTQSGTNTSGNPFEYEGITYSGLYNFFNIGAYSSASSPVKAGLVYASGGTCTTCSTDSAPAPIQLSLENYINNAGYKIEGNIVKGFNVKMSVDELKQKLQNDAISINSSNGLVGTGTTISYNGSSYTAVLYGDLSGDGQINSADLLKMRQHLQGTTKLEGAALKAGALVNGSSINSADLLKLRQHLLGTKTISQN